MGYRSAPAVNPGLPPCRGRMASRPSAPAPPVIAGEKQEGSRPVLRPDNAILLMRFCQCYSSMIEARGHSFGSVRGSAAHVLGPDEAADWRVATGQLINEKPHHTGVGNPHQSRLSRWRSLRPKLSSRPEELHLRALPEPCMTLSSHTAPDVRPLLEQLCLVHGLLPFPVGQWPRPNNAAPSLQPRYRAFDATTGCSAPVPRFGTLALAVGAACSFSLHVVGRDEAQVLTFRTKAWPSFAPPTCRMPLGQYQGIPRADPGGRVTPRF